MTIQHIYKLWNDAAKLSIMISRWGGTVYACTHRPEEETREWTRKEWPKVQQAYEELNRRVTAWIRGELTP